MSETIGSTVNVDELLTRFPTYPTHLHDAEFWEWLGRTVATFGYLENILARAIFAYSGTREYSEEAIQVELEKWVPKLEKALTGTLDRLIKAYDHEVKSHQDALPGGFDDLIADLSKAAEMRNVLCHSFWPSPDSNSASVPFFMRAKDKQVFQTPVDVKFLKQTHRAVVGLAATIINTITVRGYQFPGSSGPGKSIA